MAEALVSFLINQLSSVIKQEIEQEVRLVVGVRKEVAKLESTFMTLQAVLNDAEHRQMDEESVKIWLSKLKNAAYEIEDVLDEWGTEIQRSRLEKLELDGDKDGRTKTKRNQVTMLSSYFCSPTSCLQQVVLRRDIASRIKQILETLESIKNERDQFKFNTSDQCAREGLITHERKETCSTIVDRLDIVGRDFDQDTIVNSLLSDFDQENETRDPRIISIIGMGGLGKTTLAQLVFDHDKVKSHFDVRMWVCVSDPFDRIKVAKAIFRAAKGKETNASTWDSLFKELCESVKGKKFLLVLDDVCTHDPNNLKDLKYLLDLDDQGSRFLITTRSESVVSAFNSYKHMLQDLTSDQSSSLLFLKAFHGKENEKNKRLQHIGSRISKKCGGLPLARGGTWVGCLLGCLLNKKVNESHWRHVLESKIWELKGFDDRNLIHPIFLLSYDGLDSQLKNCFLYCAIFPKSQNIRKRTLVRLWMAQGFLHSSIEEEDPELTGEIYFDKLADRAFFQDFSMDNVGSGVCCKMHDLVHDFAQYLTRGHCYYSYNNNDTFSSNPNRNPIHLSLIYDDPDTCHNSFHDIIKKTNNVRTIQCRRIRSRKQTEYCCGHKFSIGNLSSDLIHHIRYLRVLRLKGMGITQISKEIHKLIHLRYLDLSRNEDLHELPDSICDLVNLQTLKLKRCKNLFKLPNEMGRMIKLRNLDIRYAGLGYLPKGIRNWKSLRTLSNFIVSFASEGCKIKELEHHNLLKDYLKIEGLGRLKSAEQAAEAKLQRKSQLIELRLHFGSSERTLSSTSKRLRESVLWVLQPHSNLKKLTISNYLGFNFPSWMGDTKVLTNIRFLELYKCSSCVELPALGLLPSLEVLIINGLTNLKHIGVEIYGGGQCLTEVAFPKLITWEICETKSLKVWEFSSGEVQVSKMMPRVTSITLLGCINLIALPPLNKLPSLETLKIFRAHRLTSISRELYCIRFNSMSGRGGLAQLNSFTSFPKLATLHISSMESLEVILLGEIIEEEKGDANNELSIMPCLRSLRIRCCRELKSFRVLTKSPQLVDLCNLEELKFREEEEEVLSLLPCLLDLNLQNYHHPYLPIAPNLTSIEILGVVGQSFNHIGDIARFRELQKLRLWANLESFKFIPEYVQNLRKLRHLCIHNQSGRYKGGDWSLLSHIPNIIINQEKIDPLRYSATASSKQITVFHPG
ncbi:hypothetical protein MKW92_000224 [Papaver armeniacum]|nr:hypothetical protein MKW92_000224 [Papaver armeniacum]